MKIAAIDVNLHNVTIAIDSSPNSKPRFLRIRAEVLDMPTVRQVVDELVKNGVDTLVYEDPQNLLRYKNHLPVIVDVTKSIAIQAGARNMTLIPRTPLFTSKQCPYCGCTRDRYPQDRMEPCPICGKQIDKDMAAAWNLLNRVHGVLKATPLNPIKKGVPLASLRKFLIRTFKTGKVYHVIFRGVPKGYLNDPEVFVERERSAGAKGRGRIIVEADKKETLLERTHQEYKIRLVRAQGVREIQYYSVRGRSRLVWNSEGGTLYGIATPNTVKNLRKAGILQLATTSAQKPSLLTVKA